MAKPKLSVTFNGKIIGTRSTDRLYTNVVVLADFDAEVLRKSHAASWENGWRASCIDTIVWHRKMVSVGPGGAVHVTGSARPWSYQLSPGDYVKHVAYVCGLTDDQLLEREQDNHFRRGEESIVRMCERGCNVLSWHTSRDLACKAKDAARQHHDHYLILVAPVDRAKA